MKVHRLRKGCRPNLPSLDSTVYPDPAKADFESQCLAIEKTHAPLVYWTSKFSHNGLINYKKYENVNRKLHSSSLANLLNSMHFSNWALFTLINDFKACVSHDQRSHVNDQACELLDKDEYLSYLKHTRQARVFSDTQSRKVASYAKKLAYYSQDRIFTSKRSGKYKFRTAFLTLTAPNSAEPKQICDAFTHFLDYLQRTANCIYVWKKEIGEKSGNLHFHILINNFIPFYIVAWKWKRVLLAQGVIWPSNVNGVDSNSHSRIELPRNRRQTAHYIAKYLSKAYGLPGEYGYVSGHSSILDKLKEITVDEFDIPKDELTEIIHKSKVIKHDYIEIICCDLLKVESFAPLIYSAFSDQYTEFSQKITLPQKFHVV